MTDLFERGAQVSEPKRVTTVVHIETQLGQIILVLCHLYGVQICCATARSEGPSEWRCHVNVKIERMMEEVERRGGKVVNLNKLPDDVAEQFLREVLSCPDCCATPFAGRPIDKILAGTRRMSDH